MSSNKLLGVASLAAAASLTSSAFAAAPISGSIAAMTITINDRVVDGLPAATTVNLAGDTATVVATCSGQVRATIDALGNRSVRAYDVAGRLLSVRDATGAGTDYGYDVLGRKLTEADAAISGKVRRYTYDKIGHLLSATDAIGVTTTYAYDVRDRKVSDATPMNGAETRVIHYGYDILGHMTGLTDANGAVTTWGYDKVGRQVAKAYANGDHRSMAYDAAGRLVKLTDENGHDITSSYDLAGRLIAKAYAADSTADSYAYDVASRMTSVTKGRYNHTLRYAYDPAGRLCSEIHPDGRVVNLRYDAAGRTRRVFLADGETSYVPSGYDAAYAYDARGLLAKVSYGDYATRYEYRDNGQLASTIDYRVIDPQGDILRADRTYDAGARLLGVANTAANGDQAGVVYTLGVDDQRLSAIEENGQKWNYGYDGLKQLVTAKKTDTAASVVPPLDQSYSYDPMGNRRAYGDQAGSTAYTANSANQYTAVGGLTSVYDHNGNLLSDGVKNYTWDAENQLIAVTPVNPTEGSQKVEYTYDWRMRRAGKKSYAYTSGTWNLTKTTGFKYHEWNPIAETIMDAATSTVATKSYVWGNDLSGNLHGSGGVGGLLAMQYAGNTYFHAYDGNGNVRALVKAAATNPAASSITARYAYDGFGREVAVVGVDADKSTFRFSTKQLDVESGMNYYGYRFYEANNGRWISRDPIMEEGGLSLYQACRSNCISMYDENGLWVEYDLIYTNGYALENELVAALEDYDKTSSWYSTVADALDSVARSGMNKRYAYTGSCGFIDLKHFLTAIAESQRYTASATYQAGYLLEWQQAQAGFKSAYGFEDLPSNYFGTQVAIGFYPLGIGPRDLAFVVSDFIKNELGGVVAPPSSDEVNQLNMIRNFTDNPVMSSSEAVLDCPTGIKYIPSSNGLSDRQKLDTMHAAGISGTNPGI